ncbi:universal stress protein [Halalkaliarchaeum sp. AArc-GB]|uniref:universal stress protein n=1 Tax=Halalkaliarchaeum sp. AArc-GB TaxID=3074078 RepID=UPI00285DC736|nr:universal stress protein [Halalkaliarchaeum sp. AArc-GB]MDR5673223.1 universal stress protein [Halalkaliarchaeum sp. AArc-GB]
MTALTSRILLPVANEEDATRTCKALVEHLSEEAETTDVIAVHVIEKAGGAPDKAPLAAREEQAERIFGIVKQYSSILDYTLETRLVYGTDVLESIRDLAVEEDVTSILFVPRPDGRLTRLLTGDLSAKLVLESPVPVISLPQPTAVEE